MSRNHYTATKNKHYIHVQSLQEPGPPASTPSTPTCPLISNLSLLSLKPTRAPPELKHTGAGILSMANAGPNTNGSQFFVCTANTPHLNGKHVVFGQLIDGAKVLEYMNNVATGRSDVPKAPVVIADCGQLK